MSNETFLAELETIQLDAPQGHQHTMGYGGCTQCGCTGYNPANTGGKCQSSDGKGGTCGHKYDDHKD